MWKFKKTLETSWYDAFHATIPTLDLEKLKKKNFEQDSMSQATNQTQYSPHI